MRPSGWNVRRIGFCVIALAIGIPLVTVGLNEQTAVGWDDPSDEPEGKPAGMVGVVMEVPEPGVPRDGVPADGKSFSLKAKKGTYSVTWDKKTRFIAHKVITLADVEVGEPVHVLGELVEKQPTDRGGNIPPQLIKIQAIVVGDEFEPPPVPPNLGTQRIRWVSSKLRMRGKELWVDQHLLKAGSAQEVLRVWKITAGAPAPKTPVFVGGYLDLSDKKNPKLAATEVIRIAEKYPGYELTNSFEDRKPREKDEKKKGGFGF